MEESEDNMSAEDVRKVDSLSPVRKPKKRSMVERELETSLTARVTSPANIGDGLSTSRYGRTRRLKTETELIESQKIMLASIKSPGNNSTPVKAQSPVYRMHASNSPHKAETPKKALETNLDNQIDNIYQENISLSRFSDETSNTSPAKKFPKVYIRKDLIQKRDEDETIMLIKNLFSPTNSATKSSTSGLSNLEQSSEKYNSKQNGLKDNISVVKTLDFDGNKKRKREKKEQKPILSKNELFEVEATCSFQVGDLAWARMGTFPFWPCIITRDPNSEMFVRKKLFGRVEHDIIHVTFFGDNGRRSWIVDNMLRNYMGLLEFEATREKFTPEDKKKDPKLYSAFFVSERKQGLWNKSVEESEILLREPKRLRVDIFNDMLLKFRASKKYPKSGRITRTDSDVSLSESLYDSLFSEGDVKTDDAERSMNRSRNKSFDVSEVVTACLDNMAAKTGITKIQRQSHMDRWLQKAKSKTPEKTQTKLTLAALKVEKQEKPQVKPPAVPLKLDRKASTKTKKKPTVPSQKLKGYKLRKGHQSHSKLTHEHNKSSNGDVEMIDDKSNSAIMNDSSSSKNCSLEVITKTEPLADEIGDSRQDILTVKCVTDDTSGLVLKPKNELVQDNSELSDSVAEVKQEISTKLSNHDDTCETVPKPKSKKKVQNKPVQANIELSDNVAEVKQETSKIIYIHDDASETVPKPKTKRKVHNKQGQAYSELSNSVSEVKQKISTISDDDTSKTVPKQKIKKKLQAKPVQANNALLDRIEEIKPDSSTIISIDNCTSKAGYRTRNKIKQQTTSILDNSNVSDSVKEVKQDSSTVISVDGDASENVHKMINKKKYQTKPIQANSELSDHVEEVSQDTSMIISVDNETSETVHKPNDKIFQTKLVQANSDLSYHIEEAKQGTSTTNTINDDKSNNFDLAEELLKEKSEITIRRTVDISGSPESSQDFAMEVDEEMKNADRSVQTLSEKCKPCEANIGSAMEVDDVNTSFECQVDEEKSNSKSETVSNENLEDNKIQLTDDNCNVKSDTDLNKAENVVTIVASVTETKNDDTLNNQEEGRQQESINRRKPSKSPETAINNIEFLDNSFSSKVEETINVKSGTKKTSTPENSKDHGKIETKAEKLNNVWPEKNLDLENQDLKLTDSNIFHDPKDMMDQKHISSEKLDCIGDRVLHSNETDFFSNPKEKTDFRSDESNKSNKKNVQAENNINDKDLTEDITNLLNESGNESILQQNKEIANEGCLQLNRSYKQNNKLESYSECCETKFDSESTIGKLGGSKPNPILEENHDYSTRSYVESPTFTQLLESEEFFLDINETCDNVQKSKSSEVCTQNHKVDNKTQVADDYKAAVQNLDEEYEDEETSDDEPSPEYESLDEDITEDFRKHMMSIESNITDKKDEEQIVKICNEIAEKAKLSPTKYTTDVKVVKRKEIHNTNPKDKSDINTKRELDASSNDKCDKSIEMLNQCKIFFEESTKESEAIDKQKISNMKTQSIPDKIGNIERISNKSDLEINGDATLTEIYDETKRIYRTRLSLNNVTKAPASSGIKLESSSRRFQYEPKVVITPLERDKLIFPKLTNSKIKVIYEDLYRKRKNKSRLSLKRDSPKNIHTESKSTDNSEPGIEFQESKNLKTELVVNKAETVTLNKTPKKLNIVNGSVETIIPEPVIFNGYQDYDVNRIHVGTPDLIDDSEFNIDTVSINSDDSENSAAKSVECVPRRNLRSRPDKTLENALKTKEFMEYLELRRDALIEENPELNEDDVVSYLYSTWQYDEEHDESHNLNLQGLKQETPSRNKSKKMLSKDNIENQFNEKCRKTFDVDSETETTTFDSCEANDKEKVQPKSPVNSEIEHIKNEIGKVTTKRKTRSKSPVLVDLPSEHDIVTVKDLDTVSVKSEETLTPKRTLRSKTITPKNLEKHINHVENKNTSNIKVKNETEFDTESIDSEDSEVPLRLLRSKIKMNGYDKKTNPRQKVDLTSEKEPTLETEIKEEADETASTVSDNEPLLKAKKRVDKKSLEDPEFIKFLALNQDELVDENPELTQDEVVSYLYRTWLYKVNSKSDMKKNDNNKTIEPDNLVKGLNNNESSQPKKVRRKHKVEKQIEDLELVSKAKPRRKTVQPYYNENYSDVEDELEVFEIFRTKKTPITVVSKAEMEKVKSKSPNAKSEKDNESSGDLTKTEGVKDIVEVKPELEEIGYEAEDVDAVELYFAQLTKPKPNVFKGLLREKVCDVCEYAGTLVKCKGCNGMFHPECVKKETEAMEKESSLLSKVKKRKKKIRRKRKSQDSDSQSDEKSQDLSVDISVEDIVPPEILMDADTFEEQLAVKMKEILDTTEINYDYYSSDDSTDWKDTVPGKCEIVDVKYKPRSAPIDYSDFKCNSCQKNNVPICFVCKSDVSKTDEKIRQKCHVPHCYKYYHLKCLDHWPQTQFTSGEPSKSNKKISEFFEALTCPRHVCHTCVSDDPRGCKTRFSGDKLAKCVRCPATYHSFNKCLPAGSQILTGSHIICPRHSDHRPGKVPCHVNTGWCFICAQGGSLICCEYCPTSFHAECLNIKPPEGNYMCEDCETGRLPLYGEMMWVKLGHYRWWPGIVLHPSEIPENIMAAKHGLGEFVVRFFGQYDHYWVNRGRVFPYQEGDSGRISGTKSKIDSDFTTAIEHAQRAYAILKDAEPNGEESLDIASSLLPPHYVKLKCNKPCGSLCGRKVEDPSLSLTQCECNPDEPEPCGPYSQCLNRMLLTECGPTCRAGDRCNNRAFEKRLYPKLVPYRTPHRGWGLKTLEEIKAGQFVIEYVGELIDEEEFKRRMRRKHEIRDENFYFLTLDKERMIDAGPKGNAARFMNHCCEPNCETQKWTVLGDVRVGLFAINDVPANSEVTFNYLFECASIEKKRCLCGAKRCSGYIGAKPKQEESHSKKGKDGKLPAKRIHKKKKVEESPTTKGKPPKRPLGRPPKPKELTEIEKDLLIIKNATNGLSSDESSRSQSIEDKNPKTLKRKRVSITTEEVSLSNGQEPSVKKQKCEEKPSEVGD